MMFRQRLPEQTDESQEQWKHVIDVVTLVLLQLVRKQVLVAQAPVVQPAETAQPVAVLQFAVTLQVVLTSRKVPHEVAPIHEVALIGDEESQILNLCWSPHGNHLATAVELRLRAVDASHPALVGITVCRAVHTGEQHVLSIDIFVFGTYYKVFVFLVGRSLLLTLPDGVSMSHHGLAVFTVLFQCYL